MTFSPPGELARRRWRTSSSARRWPAPPSSAASGCSAAWPRACPRGCVRRSGGSPASSSWWAASGSPRSSCRSCPLRRSRRLPRAPAPVRRPGSEPSRPDRRAASRCPRRSEPPRSLRSDPARPRPRVLVLTLVLAWGLGVAAGAASTAVEAVRLARTVATARPGHRGPGGRRLLGSRSHGGSAWPWLPALRTHALAGVALGGRPPSP